MSEEAKWYVVHTFSGYENKVKANIEKSVENRGIQHLIQNIEVPLEDVMTEDDKGNEKIVKRKVFPGYVVIKMIMTDESWYVVRNTRGVTGFVGPGSKPVPLSEEEADKMGVEKIRIADLGVAVGDTVSIISGPMEGFAGVIEEIDRPTRQIKVKVSMFGRETPVTVDRSQISLLD